MKHQKSWKDYREQKKSYKSLIILVLTTSLILYNQNKVKKQPPVNELPKMVQSITEPVKASNLTATATISVVPVEPTDMKEWVKWKTGQAGLKWEDIDCLISKESRWDDMAIYDNPNGAGVDRGLYMFSSVWHKEISNKDAFDYKKATEHFIRIVKKDKNYHQWWGYVNKCKEK